MFSHGFELERAWLASAMRCDSDELRYELIAGDASPRKFYRIVHERGADDVTTRVLMVSPATENNERFVLMQGVLSAGGIRVPTLLRADLASGYFLLEDLGDVTFCAALHDADVDALYRQALTTLYGLYTLMDAAPLIPRYEAAVLQQELDVCCDWFFRRALSLELDARSIAIFANFSECLLSSACAQPVGLVHRDYHSRNLMMLESEEIAVIDFQDALTGPVTYDLVSLLKDVYVVWPRDQQLLWLQHYWRVGVEQGALSAVSWADFVCWYDLMGLQRHTKILGVFSRLWLRDGKPAYMREISVVIAYIQEVCEMYSEHYEGIADYWGWFTLTVMPRVERADWYHAS